MVSGRWGKLPDPCFFMKDVATIGIDTSGVSLHKRGYRQMTVKAPITETLAAALIMLTPWNKDRILVDPFCGSGTFPIEAAMIAADMAPGMNRSFLAEDWKHLVPRKCWYDALEEAQDRVNTDIQTDIQGYDIDAEALKAARSNAKMAGVDGLIHFQQRAVRISAIRSRMGLLSPIRLMASVWKKKKRFRSFTVRSGRVTTVWINGRCI